VLPGIDVLEQRGFEPLAGKRVGLLTNPAGVNREGVSTVDVLRRSPKVRLTALFGPEHGITVTRRRMCRSTTAWTRARVAVFSLYGKTRRPTPEDAVEDRRAGDRPAGPGVRSYTYVSCMRYAMEECFKAGKEVVVLDRPNPLGGLKVDGPPMDKEWRSYVGAHFTPYVHGLTIGELALMAKGTAGWLEIDPKIARRGKLTVIPMQGWRRSMLWTDTGLRWVKTSPAIPDLSAAMGYSMTGLGCQLGGFVHGFGTRHPFRLLQYSGKTPEQIEAALRETAIPGLDYKVVRFEENGKQHRGVYVVVTDWNALRPTELSFHLMRIAARWRAEAGAGNPFAQASQRRVELFNKHTGLFTLWQALVRDAPQPEPSRASWTRGSARPATSRRRAEVLVVPVTGVGGRSQELRMKKPFGSRLRDARLADSCHRLSCYCPPPPFPRPPPSNRSRTASAWGRTPGTGRVSSSTPPFFSMTRREGLLLSSHVSRARSTRRWLRA
jgi:uncharacterized protein YbbC (DUF1343 family)